MGSPFPKKFLPARNPYPCFPPWTNLAGYAIKCAGRYAKEHEKAMFNKRRPAQAAAGNSIIDGVIWKQLLIFFFPILLGTFFQQLYNTADAIIKGIIPIYPATTTRALPITARM